MNNPYAKWYATVETYFEDMLVTEQMIADVSWLNTLMPLMNKAKLTEAIQKQGWSEARLQQAVALYNKMASPIIATIVDKRTS